MAGKKDEKERGVFIAAAFRCRGCGEGFAGPSDLQMHVSSCPDFRAKRRRALLCMRCRNLDHCSRERDKPREFFSLRGLCIRGQLDWSDAEKQEAIQELDGQQRRVRMLGGAERGKARLIPTPLMTAAWHHILEPGPRLALTAQGLENKLEERGVAGARNARSDRKSDLEEEMSGGVFE